MSRAEYVSIPLPEGKRLADLFGISEDLLECRDCIQLYKSLCQSERSPQNALLIDCVVTTIFIRYGRCFSSGVRTRSTQQQLEAIMDDADRRVHQLARDLRDKHFAHSVNCFESPQITVSLRIDSTDREVTSVSVGTHTILAPNMAVLDDLLLLIDKLRGWTVSEQKAESQRLLPLVQQRYSLDELYAFRGTSRRQQPTYRDVSKPRKGT